MLRKFYFIGFVSLLSSAMGCTLCCSPDDCNYGAYGGRWQRHDPACGRVGSAFAEAGYDTMAEVDAAPFEAAPIEAAERMPTNNQLRTVSFDEALDEAVSSYID